MAEPPDGELEVDHYAVLGLPSGEEGAAIDDKAIDRAYKLKALKLHPDKHRDDPAATAAFQRLSSSYALLKDPSARSAFDSLLRARRLRLARDSLLSSKRRKLARDLEERERAAASQEEDPDERARREEAEASARLKLELARVRAMMAARRAGVVVVEEEREKKNKKGRGGGGGELDKGRVLKVSWERSGGDYSAKRLKEIFTEFGEVEDVVIRSRASKSKATALVVMASKEAVVTAAKNLCGDVSNPLLVLPLEPVADLSGSSNVPRDSSSANLGNVVGSGFQAFEDYVLKKLQEAGKKQG